METEELYHVGIKRRSGRYPYGSGKNPMQHENTAIAQIHGSLDKIGDSPIPFIVTVGSVAAVAAVNKVLNKASNAKLLKMAPVLEKASNAKDKYMSRITEEAKTISLETGLNLKTKETSAYDDLQVVSEGFDNSDKNFRDNCVKASIAYYLRRMGLDVKPEFMGLSEDDEDGIDFKTLDRLIPGIIKNIRTIDVSSKDPQDILSKKIFSGIKDDTAFGTIGLSYTDPSGKIFYHLMTWEKINNRLLISDPQSGSDERVAKMFKYMESGIVSTVVDVARLDNLRINTFELPIYVKNRNE